MRQILILFFMTLSIAVFCIPPVASIANDDDQATTDLLLTVAVLNEQAPVVFQKDYYLNAEDKDIGQVETITITGNIYSYSWKKVGEIRKTDFQLMAVQLNNVDVKSIDVAIFEADYFFWQRV